MLGLDSYRNSTKECWRGWAWNQLAARICACKTKPRSDYRAWLKGRDGQKRRHLENATVLYLPGPDDADREIAISKGFRQSNLIAVDVCQDRVDGVRAGKGIAVCDTLDRVIRCWPDGWQIDGILADLCSGFGRTERNLALALIESPGCSHQTAMVVNLQRGRDKNGGLERDVTDKVRAAVSKLECGRHGKPAESLNAEMGKNRAAYWLDFFLFIYSSILFHTAEGDEKKKCKLEDYILVLGKEARPDFFSYLSKPSRAVYMDSAAFCLPKFINRTASKGLGMDTYNGEALWADFEATRRKLTAARAVRTARLSKDAA
jgi:hypothetical protein